MIPVDEDFHGPQFFNPKVPTQFSLLQLVCVLGFVGFPH